jgi:aminoglycoside phosphotransferase (APT) family kinase protein
MRAASARWTDIFGKPAPAAESAVNDIVVLDQLRRRLRALRRRLEPYFATLRPVCFLDDLTTKNVLAESGQLQGLIDFDVVCYGDPLMAVGTTLAHLTVDSGDIGHFYGEELLRSYGATGDALRAVYFYGALWLVGFVAAAESSGNAERARKLETMADAMLRPGETP